MKRVNIIATLGPASSRLNIIRGLVEEGVDIFRLNTKYVDFKEFEKFFLQIKKFKKVKIMVDIKNRKNLDYYKDKKIDYVAISFAESAYEIKKIKKLFSRRVKVISKIETEKGVKNIDELIKVSDGIMIARGDLGRNLSIEKVPIIQKLITKKCKSKGRMVITATEIMLSMVKYVRPTRAEVSDVANAILEGSNALMLSEETATGKHPVLCVRIMDKLIKEIERYKLRIK